jgi:ribose transport system substrate-binding protein
MVRTLCEAGAFERQPQLAKRLMSLRINENIAANWKAGWNDQNGHWETSAWSVRLPMDGALGVRPFALSYFKTRARSVLAFDIPRLKDPEYMNMRTNKSIRFGIKAAAAVLLLVMSLAIPSYAQKPLKGVAVTVGDLGNPFFVQIAHGAQDAAKKINPSVKFSAESSNYDVNNQTNQMDNFVSSGVSLILLNAADSKGIAPAVMRAKAAGIVVVAVDVGAEGGVDATVTSNNKQAGELDGKYVADRLKGKGQIVIVNGPPVTAVTDRVAGFTEEIKKYPDIKILSQDQNAGGSRDGGLRVMTDLLTAFKKIDAVFAINDPTAIGCDLAAKQAQRKDFFIVGVDGAPDVVPSLKDKDSLIAASAAQDPYTMSGKAVQIGYDIMNGKKPDQPLTLIPVDLITKENVDQYKGWTK